MEMKVGLRRASRNETIEQMAKVLKQIGFGTLVLLLGALMMSGCMSAYVKSVGGDTDRVFSRIFVTDLNTAWQSVLESLKSNQLDISNREAGIVQTRWSDNTSEKNMTDAQGSIQPYLKAQYRFRISVAEGFFNGIQSVRVGVQKEQMVQRDVLEGWIPAATDTVDENTLLYRVGRIISIRMKMEQIEEQKKKEELKRLGF